MAMTSTTLVPPFASNNPDFLRLQGLQKTMGNITTYVDGELNIVEYPANAEGEPVSPSHVWLMLVTHDVPRLFCFHGKEAWVRMPGPGTAGVAMCRSDDDLCGYLVDFFQIAKHPNLRTKVYNYRESAVQVAMETTPDRRATEDDLTVDLTLDNMTPPPSRATTRATTPSLEIGPGDVPDTPPPPYNTASSDAKIRELVADLQSQRGVATERFWRLFRQCKSCPFIVKKDSHHTCTPIIDLTTDDGMTIIDLTSDDEATIIDLTNDDEEMD